MEISKSHKERLLGEIRFIRDKMKGEKDLRTKAFYYTGIFEELMRLNNMEYHPQLVLMHLILSTTYNTIFARISAVMAGDTTIPMPTDFFDNLDIQLAKLENNIENDEDTYTVLEKIVSLTYLLTGNGFYLSQKGVKVYYP